MGPCIEGEAQLMCKSNSTSVHWEVKGHNHTNTSAITGTLEGFIYRTEGGPDGLLHSVLVINTSLDSIRHGVWQIHCHNERTITGNFICVHFNGHSQCFDEIACDDAILDCKTSTLLLLLFMIISVLLIINRQL